MFHSLIITLSSIHKPSSSEEDYGNNENVSVQQEKSEMLRLGFTSEFSVLGEADELFQTVILPQQPAP